MSSHNLSIAAGQVRVIRVAQTACKFHRQLSLASIS